MLQLTFNPGLTLTGFRTTRPRLELIMASFNLHFSSPSIWNDLDEEIKSLSLRLFKQYMTKQSLSSYA